MDDVKKYADPNHLLDVISKLTNDDILTAIAHADYGKEVEEHLGVLQKIRAGMYTFDPRLYYWHPLEVVELTRWTEPGEPGHGMGISEYDHHIARAFCCSLILRLEGDFPNYSTDDGIQTLIQFIRSVEVLGHKVEMAAFMFLAWRVSDLKVCGAGSAYFIIVLLYLYLRVSKEPDRDFIENLAIQAIEEEHRERKEWVEEPTGWLLPLTVFDIKRAEWKIFFKKLESLLEGVAPPDTSALYQLKMNLGA